jgi:hypothetical protein
VLVLPVAAYVNCVNGYGQSVTRPQHPFFFYLLCVQANSESFVLFILCKATSRWTRSRSDQNQLVPAFNGFQVRPVRI